MFETRIKWHNASEELPNKSCEVIVLCADCERNDSIYAIMDVNYSSRHKSFNCHDFSDCPNSRFSDDVKYWAYFDELRSEFSTNKKTAENGNSQTV